MEMENLINYINTYFVSSNKEISLEVLESLLLNVDYAIKERRNSERTPTEEAYDKGFQDGKDITISDKQDYI